MEELAATFAAASPFPRSWPLCSSWWRGQGWAGAIASRRR